MTSAQSAPSDQRWDTLRRPHRAGYASWRAAQALLHDGQRGLAASALQTARQRSDQHVPLTDAITDPARLARVALEPPPAVAETSDQTPPKPPALGLTNREFEVLRLLTEGSTRVSREMSRVSPTVLRWFLDPAAAQVARDLTARETATLTWGLRCIRQHEPRPLVIEFQNDQQT